MTLRHGSPFANCSHGSVGQIHHFIPDTRVAFISQIRQALVLGLNDTYIKFILLDFALMFQFDSEHTQFLTRIYLFGFVLDLKSIVLEKAVDRENC